LYFQAPVLPKWGKHIFIIIPMAQHDNLAT